MFEQCDTRELEYGDPDNSEDSTHNLRLNYILESIFDFGIDDYKYFLLEKEDLWL